MEMFVENEYTIKADYICQLFPKKDNDIPYGYRIVKVLVKDCSLSDSNIYVGKKIVINGELPQLKIDGDYQFTVKAYIDNKYGLSFKVTNIKYETELKTEYDARKYFENKFKTAPVQYSKLVESGVNMLDLLKNNDVKKLSSIIGNKTKAEKVLNEYKNNKDQANIISGLSKYNLSNNAIKKLIDKYGNSEKAIQEINSDVYKLMEIDGYGFKKADECFLKGGGNPLSPKRIKAYIMSYLHEEAENGNSWIKSNVFTHQMYTIFGESLDRQVFGDVLKELESNKKIYYDRENKRIALMSMYKLECRIANEFKRIMNNKLIKHEENWKEIIENIQIAQGWNFTDEQYNGIEVAMNNSLVLITGLAGCVDSETEYFNGFEWKKISKYKQGEQVLQFNNDRTANLVNPLRYVKLPCEEMYHFETKYGLDQTLSEDHIVTYVSSKGNINYKPFLEFKKMHEDSKNGFNGKFITTFDYDNNTKFDLTDEEIRVMVAVIADGSYYTNYENINNRCRIHIKKERKQIRLENLLKDANIEYSKHKSVIEGYYDYYFNAPRKEKHYTKEWYNCNKHQREIIADEVLNWDGHINGKRRSFSTTIKESADFIQFVFSSLGIRTVVKKYDRRGSNKVHNDGVTYTRKSIEYEVGLSSHSSLISIGGFKNSEEKTKITKVKNTDGYKYCFSVPSEMLVLRRNGKIFITHNCGKSSLVKGLTSVYPNNINLVQCALSGCASQRIKQTSNNDANTIHKTLGINFATGGFLHNKDNPLNADIVILDEASMVSGSLFYSLLCAIGDNTKLVILGDYGQLESIGNCNVFFDLIKSNIPVVKLTKVHRQAQASAIISKSIGIRNKQQLFDKDFRGRVVLGELQDLELNIDTKDKLQSYAVRQYVHHAKRLGVENVMGVTAMRERGQLSCYELNNIIQGILIEDKSVNITRKLSKDKEYKFYIGDLVINTKNNYKAMDILGNQTAIFNGNTGIVKSIENGTMIVSFFNIGDVVLEKDDINNLELAYFITTHKSQGEQRHTVIVALDYSAYTMLCNELLYTAITRAIKYCVLVGENSAIRKAISTSKTSVKNTFLCELLENKTN